jgi:hypothetical protein
VDVAEFWPTVLPGLLCPAAKQSARTLTNRNASDSFILKFLHGMASDSDMPKDSQIEMREQDIELEVL